MFNCQNFQKLEKTKRRLNDCVPLQQWHYFVKKKIKLNTTSDEVKLTTKRNLLTPNWFFFIFENKWFSKVNSHVLGSNVLKSMVLNANPFEKSTWTHFEHTLKFQKILVCEATSTWGVLAFAWEIKWITISMLKI